MSDAHLHIKYSKETKTYFVHTDDNPNPVIELDNEIHAMAYVIGAQDLRVIADIRRMVEKYPQLEARGLRGAMLYLDGHVTDQGDGTFKVLSQPGTISYTVSGTQSGVLACTCPDFRNNAPEGPPGRKFCKHIIAQVLFHRYHQSPKSIATTHRGREVITQVKGNGHTPAYFNGQRIEAEVMGHAQIYKERVGSWPPDREKLMAWVYR